jgi:hypothetical protein
MAKAEADTSSELPQKSRGRCRCAAIPTTQQADLGSSPILLTAKSLNGGKRQMSDPKFRHPREHRQCPTRTAAVSYIYSRALSPACLRSKCRELTKTFAECFAQASRLARVSHSK